MLRLNRLIKHPINNSTRTSFLSCQQQQTFDPLPPHLFCQKASTRFLDIYQLGNKAAIEKERARLADEMNRGYFADMSELNKHGGKIAMANKIIIPAVMAMKFPDFEVNFSDGRTLKLPIRSNGNVADDDASAIPKASLLCLSFRASSQAMIDSWSVPFLEAFGDAKNIQLYEVSFIDSRLLCLSPIKRLLLRIMRKSNIDGNHALQKQIVYSFGDHYYFRKELKILNLLTGYIFLLDKFGRIRWQGYGLATQEELSSLTSCTSFLLEEKLGMRPHYNLNPQGISVDGQTLAIDRSIFSTSSTQGTIIDSRTAFAYLAKAAYNPFVEAIITTVNVSQYVKPYCSRENQCYSITSSINEIFPQVGLNFASGASMILNPKDYLQQEKIFDAGAVVCIGFQKSLQGITILGGSTSANVSATMNTGKIEFVNAGTLCDNSSPRDMSYNLIPMTIMAFLLHMLMLGSCLFL